MVAELNDTMDAAVEDTPIPEEEEDPDTGATTAKMVELENMMKEMKDMLDVITKENMEIKEEVTEQRKEARVDKEMMEKEHL